MPAFDPDAGCTLTDDLIAFWKLDESDDIRFDSIVPGTGNAAQFTRANSESLSHVDNADLSTGDIDFTIACWFFLDTLPSVTGSMTLISKHESTTATQEYLLELLSSDQVRWGVRETPGNGGVFVTVTETTTLTTGTFNFVVAWYDSIADTVNIQLNNGTVFSTSGAAAPGDTTAVFAIGRNSFGSGVSFMNGRIDEAGFWKRVLTSQERTDLYNSGNGNTYEFSETCTIITAKPHFFMVFD